MADSKKTVEKKVKTEETALVKKEFTALFDVDRGYTKEQKEFIKNTLAPTLNDNEILLFVYRAQKLGLNPLAGEIFAYASYETVNDQKVRKMVVIVARDGKRKIAFQTGHLRSIKTEPIYIKTEVALKETGKAKALEEKVVQRVKPWEGGILWGAACTIIRDDYPAPFEVTVPLAEYKRSNRIWGAKPETMIKKVATSQCLSMAFPELAGVYDESERWDNENGEEPVKIEGGDLPMTEAQAATIKSLGGIVTDGEEMTKQEAANCIKELARPTKKGSKNG